MSLHDQFATNVEKEIEGVEIQYGPNSDGTVPTFNISRASKANKAYTKALERATRPYRRQIELGTMPVAQSDSVYLEVFIETILKGWKNVQSKDGTAIPFSKESAKKLFTELPELYDDLNAKAQSATLFRDEALEEEAGN